ncbi:hypothetical protein Lal_00028100 [Lupinus albus]|nr:hypothetical protein Lal_00028100 [Lupinus albus]
MDIDSGVKNYTYKSNYELLILDFNNPIDITVPKTYPNLQYYNDEHFLQFRAIFISTIEITIVPGEENAYLSSDSIDMSDANESETFNILTLEFLH